MSFFESLFWCNCNCERKDQEKTNVFTIKGEKGTFPSEDNNNNNTQTQPNIRNNAKKTKKKRLTICKAKKRSNSVSQESAIFTNADELQKIKRQILLDEIPNSQREINSIELMKSVPFTMINKRLLGAGGLKINAMGMNTPGKPGKKNGITYFSISDKADKRDILLQTESKDLLRDYEQIYWFVVYYDDSSSHFRIKVNLETWENIKISNYISISLPFNSSFIINTKWLIDIFEDSFKFFVIGKNWLEVTDLNTSNKYVFNPLSTKTVRIGNVQGDHITIKSQIQNICLWLTFNEEMRKWVLEEKNKVPYLWMLTRESKILEKGMKIRIGKEIIDVI